MNVSKFGFVLLAAAALATPACFTAGDDDDDDDGGEGGESGEGSGGSSGGTSGKGGTSGSGGSGATGGSSGSSGSSGSGGGSGAGSCDADDLALTFDCPAGTFSQFDDPICDAYYSCTFASICTSSGLSCSACEPALLSGFTAEDLCLSEDDFATIGEACLLAADSMASTYPECVFSQ